MRKMVLQGGTTPDDYSDVDREMFHAFLHWKKELDREWSRFQKNISTEEMLAWSRDLAEEKAKRAQVSQQLRDAVATRDRRRCRYCGKPLMREDEMHIDHVHPFSKGGPTIIGNLVASCKDCNLKKKYLRAVHPSPVFQAIAKGDNLQGLKRVAEKRRRTLFECWEKMLEDPRQHNLEAEAFFTYYRRCQNLTKDDILQIAMNVPRNPLDQAYDVMWWIAHHCVEKWGLEST